MYTPDAPATVGAITTGARIRLQDQVASVADPKGPRLPQPGLARMHACRRAFPSAQECNDKRNRHNSAQHADLGQLAETGRTVRKGAYEKQKRSGNKPPSA